MWQYTEKVYEELFCSTAVSDILIFGSTETSIMYSVVIILHQKCNRGRRCVNMETFAVLTTHYLCKWPL